MNQVAGKKIVTLATFDMEADAQQGTTKYIARRSCVTIT